VNKTQWKGSGKSDPKLTYDGAFFLQNQHYKGFYKINQLESSRWVTKGANQVNLLIPNHANPATSVMIISPSVKYQENKTSHQAKFKMIISGNGIFPNGLKTIRVILEK
jgi:spore germination protein KC